MAITSIMAVSRPPIELVLGVLSVIMLTVLVFADKPPNKEG